MRSYRRSVVIAGTAGLMVTGCGNETTAPPMVTAEQSAIAAAAAEAGVMSGRGGTFSTLALGQVGDRASMGSFQAFGIQVVYDLVDVSLGTGRDVGWFVGVVGYSGLDVAARTAAEVISAGAGASGVAVMGSGSVQIGQIVNSREGVALFARRSPSALYVGNSGTFTLQSATFSSPRICGTTSGTPSPVTCTYATGTMTGTFDFMAGLLTGTGAATYTQAQTTFTLPAIQVTMSQQ